jgi:hypothetical protein
VARLGLRLDAPPSDDDVKDSHARLARFSRQVLREMHEKTIGGKPVAARPAPIRATTDAAEQIAKGTPAAAYTPSARYEVGALVTHPRFGAGIVTAIEPGRVEILFPDGPRKLVGA